MDPLFNRNLNWMEFSLPTIVKAIDMPLDGVFSANQRNAKPCAVGWSFLRQLP